MSTKIDKIISSLNYIKFDFFDCILCTNINFYDIIKIILDARKLCYITQILNHRLAF